MLEDAMQNSNVGQMTKYQAYDHLRVSHPISKPLGKYSVVTGQVCATVQ